LLRFGVVSLLEELARVFIHGRGRILAPFLYYKLFRPLLLFNHPGFFISLLISKELVYISGLFSNLSLFFSCHDGGKSAAFHFFLGLVFLPQSNLFFLPPGLIVYLFLNFLNVDFLGIHLIKVLLRNQ
jgi:hypothetical protein